MVLSLLTLGLYGVYTVLRDAQVVGHLVGKKRTSLPAGIVLTVLTLGIFPGIYVVVLAFDLQRHARSAQTAGRQHLLGPIVLILDLLSLCTALMSGGLAIAISVVLWSYACHLISREISLYALSAPRPPVAAGSVPPNTSFERTRER
jgi:hypothetical protein